MTVQEAIKILNPDADDVWKAYDGKDLERCNEACRVACVALEKQIPKKPVLQECGFFDVCLVCPKCKQHIVNVWSKAEYKPNFCHYCGQKLDWSDDNDL